ncbi:hypothetical protein LGH70_19650 [Hymenobacter sp. BT635]|uniref:Uncharacterized protein n=1 Tax=Hymenobacter nitidus TaxID=2880929 RepID=A0ABS8AIY2_9BACT|nr:hypothetical protein [Hymenobacter nitidus]MCB2379821.1 hypothetical protein [Hymenobacter nitidus]
MKKSIFNFVSTAVQPVAYPACAAYHAIVGSAATWIVRGLPHDYSFAAVGWSIAGSIVVGGLLVLVLVSGQNQEAK